MHPSRSWIPVASAALALAGVAAAQDSRVPGAGELGGPSPHLTAPELELWLRGRRLFDHAFHRSDGLGAHEMNADSCRGCHQDPVLGGAGALELNVSRFARDNLGFGPFQDLPGGQAASRLRPPYVPGREEYNASQADVFEQRQTPALFGAGLLDAVPAAEILAREDRNDADGDGIRGVARRLTVDGRIEFGRFGWKAQVPRLRDFVKDAMAGELGITTPDDRRGFAMLRDADATTDPEIDEAKVEEVFFFMANLAPPRRVGSLDPQVTMGELLFGQIGCAKCHVPELASPAGPVRAFTDLLLHEVWPANFRGMAEPGAAAGVYRTAPLWGIRLSAPYMHDGRAETLRGAILAHAGEAFASKIAFRSLTALDQQALLAFLEDL
jgi:CxxC motif-containing protein (DUF1111 family)